MSTSKWTTNGPAARPSTVRARRAAPSGSAASSGPSAKLTFASARNRRPAAPISRGSQPTIASRSGGRIGGAKIGITVDIGEADVGMDAAEPRDDPERDRAVSADHEGLAARRDDVFNRVRDLAGNAG